MSFKQRIILIRHAQAVERDDFPGLDADRPLTGKGSARAAAVAGLVLREGPMSVAWVSPRLRTQQTFEVFQQENLRLHKRTSVADVMPCIDMTYDVGKCWTDITQWLTSHPEVPDLYIFGHEPHFSGLLSHLLGGPPEAYIVKKSGVIWLRVEAKQKSARLEGLLNPLQLFGS